MRRSVCGFMRVRVTYIINMYRTYKSVQGRGKKQTGFIFRHSDTYFGVVKPLEYGFVDWTANRKP